MNFIIVFGKFILTCEAILLISASPVKRISEQTAPGLAKFPEQLPPGLENFPEQATKYPPGHGEK